MNELDPKPSAIEIKEVKEVRKERHTSQMISLPGLILWEYNTMTHVLRRAEFELIQKQIDQQQGFIVPKIGGGNGIVTVKKLKQNPNCSYFQALNHKNAMKKIEKNFR